MGSTYEWTMEKRENVAEASLYIFVLLFSNGLDRVSGHQRMVDPRNLSHNLSYEIQWVTSLYNLRILFVANFTVYS